MIFKNQEFKNSRIQECGIQFVRSNTGPTRAARSARGKDNRHRCVSGRRVLRVSSHRDRVAKNDLPWRGTRSCRGSLEALKIWICSHAAPLPTSGEDPTSVHYAARLVGPRPPDRGHKPCAGSPDSKPFLAIHTP